MATTFLEPGPDGTQPDDFVDLNVSFGVDEIQCPSGKCDWYPAPKAGFAIKQLFEVGRDASPEKSDTFTVDQNLSGPDPFDGSMSLKIGIERWFP